MPMIPGVCYTRTEQEIMDRFSDGRRHSLKVMVAEVGDDPTDRTAVAMRVSRLRKKLDGTGYTIVCEFYQRQTHYRLVRLITQNE